MVSKIETYHDICVSTFDICKTTNNEHRKIKTWISTYDADEAHAEVLEKTQADGKYQDCGEWLISSLQFKNWSSVDAKSSHNVFWLRGTGMFVLQSF